MGKYDDIIHLSRPASSKRARMSMVDRGAQFSPFAALVGYDAVIGETGRLTHSQASLSESRVEELDRHLRLLAQAKLPRVQVTWFVPDERKSGGAYVSRSGQVARVDARWGQLLLTDGTRIPFDAIFRLESPVLNGGE